MAKIDTLTHRLEVLERERRFSRFSRRSRGTSRASGERSPNRAFFVKDHVSNKSFMVDTGSSCSVWPLRLVSNQPKKLCISLHAVNLSTIDTYGQVSLTLDLRLRRCFRWIFIITDLPYPILGVDFRGHFNLLVDVRRQKLVDNFTSLSAPARSITNTLFSPKFFIASADNQFHSRLSSYIDLVDPIFNSTKVLHSTVHHITTTGPPVFPHLLRLAPDRFRKAKAEFDHMLQLGLIRPSKRPWASPLHLVN